MGVKRYCLVTPRQNSWSSRNFSQYRRRDISRSLAIFSDFWRFMAMFICESGLLENEPTVPAEQAHTTRRGLQNSCVALLPRLAVQVLDAQYICARAKHRRMGEATGARERRVPRPARAQVARPHCKPPYGIGWGPSEVAIFYNSCVGCSPATAASSHVTRAVGPTLSSPPTYIWGKDTHGTYGQS